MSHRLNHNIIIFNFFTQKIIDFKDRVQDIFFHKNPLGIVIASQLAAQETRGNPLLRFEKKFSITRQLYQKGLKKDAIITLYKMIDWSIKLPKELELRYKAKIHQLEEEKKVSYITSIERLSKEEGLQQGREEGIQLNAIAIAKKLIAQGRSIQYIQDLTNLSESEVIKLFELEKV